ncbi:MAG: hypothetical protein LBD68_03195 [Zoogloeaceae bacterium]|nr:hypothetical protein [Zoogloeaceae bacterium]
MFRKIRIFLLLLALLAVAASAWRSNARLRDWARNVDVAIYPLAADASPQTARFLQTLSNDSFDEIETWLEDEARRYGVSQDKPVRLWLGPQVTEKPPEYPSRAPGMLDAILWSLRLRWWASRHDDIHIRPHVRLFVFFHAAPPGARLPHSIGLREGKIGVIHVFADARQARQNLVIIAHELLHTFGAADKYDPASLQPLYPHGYAEPERQPLLPQSLAEIMGGRVPVDAQTSRIPENLSETRIGAASAREIGLLKNSD